MPIDSKKYPEHAKLEQVKEKTQFVHNFLMFCEEKEIYLEKNEVYQQHQELLYKFTGIDQWKLEDEKRKMLDEFVSASKQAPRKV